MIMDEDKEIKPGKKGKLLSWLLKTKEVLVHVHA
jgi:hypothetical protein